MAATGSSLRLSDFKLLCFDVYGTLVDWENGIIKASQPLLSKLGVEKLEPKAVLETFNQIELDIQTQDPGLNYQKVLAKVHAGLVEKLSSAGTSYVPSETENAAFAESIGSWSAFPDTVGALKELSKYYKLVVLSNVDKESFAKTNKGPLEEFPFDSILTAEEIGSYKPDPRNFTYMLEHVQQEFGISKEHVLPTAVSLYHDHIPANKLGFCGTAWIARPNSIMGVESVKDAKYNWKFESLQDMADARKKED